MIAIDNNCSGIGCLNTIKIGIDTGKMGDHQNTNFIAGNNYGKPENRNAFQTNKPQK